MAAILLAEDDPTLRQFLRTALEKSGHSVTACPDGQMAFDTLRASATGFDLLLTDIVMPGIDGLDLARRANEFSPQLKVMFITGFAAMKLGGGEVEALHARVLSKPFHLSHLVEQVNLMLADE